MPPKPRYYNLVDRIPGMENLTLETEVMQKILNNSFINYFLAYRFGVCVPSACNIEDVRNLVAYVGKLINLGSAVPMCETKDHKPPDSVEMGIILAMAVIAAVVLILTLIDVAPMFWSCGKPENLVLTSFTSQLARACSLNANTVRLVSPNSPEPRTDCLNGIKFFSITWVILGHSYLLINWQLIKEQEFNRDEIMKPIFQVVMNALLSVDTFFLVTSFLIASISISLVDKVGKQVFNVPLFIVNRIFRLLPVIVLGTGLAVLLPLIGDGPAWHETVDIVARNCRNNWWYNFIFIGNFVDPREMCMPLFWYAVCDMQLLFVAIIFLLIVFYKPVVAISFASITVVLSCIATAVITSVKDLQPTILLFTPDTDTVLEAWVNSHFMPFVHVAPYAIGLIFGYLFAKHSNIIISPIVQCCLWIVSFASGLLVTYGTAWWNSGKNWEPAETLLYAGLHRCAWSLSVGWLIFACCTGRGGVINRILSWKGFFPASRLTYSAYAVHCLVIWFFVGHNRGHRGGQVEATWYFLGNLCMTFGISVLCYLFVEAPFNQIFKTVIQRLHNSAKKQEQCNGVGVDRQETCRADTDVKMRGKSNGELVNTRL